MRLLDVLDHLSSSHILRSLGKTQNSLIITHYSLKKKIKNIKGMNLEGKQQLLAVDSLPSDNGNQACQFMVYKQRWAVLLAFSMFSFSNAFGFVQNSPILGLSADYYGVDQNSIVWFSNVYYIAYITFGIFAIKPLQIRLDISVWFATALTAGGGWLKYFADQNYTQALIGYCMLGCGQLFILAAPVYISDRWFPREERTLSTSIGSFINQIGMNFSFIFVTLFFLNTKEANQNIPKQKSLNFIYAIINTSAFVLCLIFFRNKPETPPSYSASLEKVEIVKSLKKILSKKRTCFNLFSLSIFLGISWTYTSVVAIILDPYGYSQFDIGIVGLVFTLSGTLGGCLASLYIDISISKGKIPPYDPLIKFFMTLGLLALIAQAITIKYDSFLTLCIQSALVGIGLNSYFPIASQSLIESIFPCFELVLMTLFIILANIFGFVGNIILVIPSLQSESLWILVGLLTPFYLYTLVFYKTKLLRLKIENEFQVIP